VIELAVIVALGCAGAWIWRRWVVGRLVALGGEDSSIEGLALFVVAMAVSLGTGAASLAGPTSESISLPDQVSIQGLANVLGVAVMLAVAARRPGGLGALGLRAHHGAHPLAVAAGGWMMLLPALAVITLVNRAILGWLDATTAQESLMRFVEEDAARSPAAWIGMVGVIPACEEIMMRGGLYGGLRRAMSPPAAMAASAAVFALVHDPAVQLPVAALGLALAWLYERTGSLLVPILVHALQNGFTLVMATVQPEIVS